ncbi:hypothetical protein vBSlqSZDD2_22 [Serratia phage vB_SlqS_ZDD2]|nr:hypothetical protein vBSlqSZDD2_22 [Serratia phage vB_SlqS_ZDD2]
MKFISNKWKKSVLVFLGSLALLAALVLSTGWVHSVIHGLYWVIYVFTAVVSCLLYFIRWRMVTDSIMKQVLRDVSKRPKPMREYYIFDHIQAITCILALGHFGYQWLALLGLFNWIAFDYITRFHNRHAFGIK